MTLRRFVLGLAVAFGAAAALPAGAADVEGCPGLVASGPAALRSVAWETGRSRPAPVRTSAPTEGRVGLTFVGHATFVIESPKGVRIATDYSDATRPAPPPDVATMNKAHSTHFSHRPDPRIRHVLRGWNPSGGAASHDLQVEDVRIRNVSTNIRDWGGGTEYDANSIFVFETAQLCIAHLGHLHHTLAPSHLEKLGRIDVLLVPVDGGYTLETFDMVEVLRAINAPLMIPMHFFGPSTLQRFLASAREHFPVEYSPQASIALSRETLPRSPKILVLPGH
ncbi:MAG TPA: MBL fold metallo-hydrolase [Microvirga sp.]|jgi:L-ascorbate metabolism protein UlaG (beta-lactamase superfamily)|nr:MBL fold metallo-hydrolase [Microvirga sp.]